MDGLVGKGVVCMIHKMLSSGLELFIYLRMPTLGLYSAVGYVFSLPPLYAGRSADGYVV